MNLRDKIPTTVKRKTSEVITARYVGTIIDKWFGGRVPYKDQRIDTSSNRVTPETSAKLFWNIYESAEARFVERYIKPNINVIELGGGIGVISCLIRKKISDNKKLIIVEADRELLKVARKNININHPGRDTVLLNLAISYESENKVTFERGVSNVGGKIKNEVENERSIEVKSGKIKHVEKYVDGEYALVSDIEGAEVGVFLESDTALSECRQIIIELHNTVYKGEKVSVSECIKIISKSGFTLKDKYGPVCHFEKH
jgi:FkbM family methyltransferase